MTRQEELKILIQESQSRIESILKRIDQIDVILKEKINQL